MSAEKTQFRWAIRRRELIRSSLALPVLAGLGVTSCSRQKTTWEGGRWRDFLEDVAAILIPHTDTAAADDPYVWAEDVALNAIYVGMDDATFDMVATIKDALDNLCGGAYLGASDVRRFEALEQLDGSSYAAATHAAVPPSSIAQPSLPQQPHHQDAASAVSGDPQTPLAIAWRKIKGLLLLGYYTSEAGASKELVYALVPGRFDPDVHVTPATRAISSDWFAVSFR